MAHELSISADGRASMAFIGPTPWHGLGQQLTPGADLVTWRREAGLEWSVERSIVEYKRKLEDGSIITERDPENLMLYRSDTGKPLSIRGKIYKTVQPEVVFAFYRDLATKYGFEMETAGHVKGGRRIWALANCRNVIKLRGDDRVALYLLFATSYDGTMSTQVKLTPIRVVCNNTLSAADRDAGRACVIVPHSANFDAEAVKLDMGIDETFERFGQQAKLMTERVVQKDEVVQLFMKAYYDLSGVEEIREFHDDPKNKESAEKLMKRLTNALFNSPGANLASARGTLWGALNAVTYDVDFAKPARSQENRLNSAWFGDGAAIKQRAHDAALALVA